MLKVLDFQVVDSSGNLVDLQGADISFSIVFGEAPAV